MTLSCPEILCKFVNNMKEFSHANKQYSNLDRTKRQFLVGAQMRLNRRLKCLLE